MLEVEFKLKIQRLKNELMLDIATLRCQIEEEICKDYNINKLLLLQSEMILKELHLKWINLGNYHKLPYPI